MNLNEKEIFCAHIMAAARSMMIGIGRIKMETGFRFVWNDQGTRIECPSSATEKEAMFLACEALQKYLQIPWYKEQDRPDTDIYGPLTGK